MVNKRIGWSVDGRYLDGALGVREFFQPVDSVFWQTNPGGIFFECENGSKREAILYIDHFAPDQFSVRYHREGDRDSSVLLWDVSKIDLFEFSPADYFIASCSIAPAYVVWDIVQRFFVEPEIPALGFRWIAGSELKWPNSCAPRRKPLSEAALYARQQRLVKGLAKYSKG